jgi:hypothetical protein
MGKPTKARRVEPVPATPAQRCRFRVPRPVEILPDKESRPRFLGYAANLSETGMFVQCSVPRPPGTRFALKVHLPGVPDGLVCREVEVIWTRGYAGANGPAAGMGTRFVTLDPLAAQAVRKLIADPSRAETGIRDEPARAVALVKR